MNVLTVTALSKSFGGRTILDDFSFAIGEKEKVGFVGANGSGKSTLFRIIAGLESADTGDVALRRGTHIGYLAQAPALEAGLSIRACVAEGRPAAQAARPEWEWAHRVEAMLSRLGVGAWDRAVADLSGGEAKRVALARTLLAEPDLLLLDEPTNHLDADTVLFLEEYLVDHAGAVMLVTHDRYFLDRVVDRMIELAHGRLTSFEGGYTEYLEAQAEREARAAVEDAKRQRLIAQELAWARRSPPARTGKQRARLRRTKQLEAESQGFAGRRTRDVTLWLAETPRLGRTVLDIHGISKTFGDRTLMRDFSTMLRAGERVGVIGPNGAGKTTLVRMIIGEEAPDTGSIVSGVNTRIAYFDQLRAGLDPELSVYEAAGGTDWVEVGGRRVHLRSYLEDFLFPTARQQQKVASLSGGERNRLMLARLFMQPSNLLILDEPTNDLDLVTLQVLEAALLDYSGCVLMVTHDRYFLDKLATALLVFEGDGVVHRHEGGYDLYRRLRDEQEAARRVRQPTPSGAQAARRAPSPEMRAKSRAGLSWKEQRELEGLESRILEAEAERDALGARLAEPELYRDGDEAARITSAFHEAESLVAALYDRWTELEERNVDRA
jgi:ABC transport system ATP-binding/permease protein